MLLLSAMCISCIISYSKKHQTQDFYALIENQNLNLIAKIIDVHKDNGNNKYIIQIVNINNKNTYCGYKLILYSNVEMKEGSTIWFCGAIDKPDVARNYGGFNYRNYLLSKKILGITKCSNVKTINENAGIVSCIRSYIKNTLSINLPNENANFCIALLLGDKESLDSEVIQNFSNSALSHVLAISGLHVSIIATAVYYAIKHVGKQHSFFLIIIFILFFCNLVYMTESVMRAGIMIIIFYISKIVHTKSDSITNLAISVIFILSINPYSIYSTGFIMSVAGTLGIILFYGYFRKKYSKIRSKVLNYMCSQVSLSISANILLLPILLRAYNKFSFLFIISGPIAGLLLMIIIIISLALICIGWLKNGIILFLSKVLTYLTTSMMRLSEIFSNIDALNIITKTPSIYYIVLYYLVLYLMFIAYKSNQKDKIIIKRIIKATLVLCICITSIVKIITWAGRDLKIFFVDVNQGDSTLIVTPRKKRILIDGGGDDSENNYIGNNVLVPYLLDRGITSIDYIIVSHFDTDHVRGLLAVIESINVNNVVIAKQTEENHNYNEFIKIVIEKKINVITVKQGDILKVESEIYFDVLWPRVSEQVNDNAVNNNSIVCRLNYKNFSILFTGDIERTAENEIVNDYKNKLNMLNTTALKVAHHGSKSSSTEEFINVVNPKVALIGVGKNNKFGHPSESTINRLKQHGIHIYRTDVMGEITVIVNSNGGIKIKKHLETEQAES